MADFNSSRERGSTMAQALGDAAVRKIDPSVSRATVKVETNHQGKARGRGLWWKIPAGLLGSLIALVIVVGVGNDYYEANYLTPAERDRAQLQRKQEREAAAALKQQARLEAANAKLLAEAEEKAAEIRAKAKKRQEASKEEIESYAVAACDRRVKRQLKNSGSFDPAWSWKATHNGDWVEVSRNFTAANGFGATIDNRYVCSYSRAANAALDSEVMEGFQ